jgi:hypothetical protein
MSHRLDDASLDLVPENLVHGLDLAQALFLLREVLGEEVDGVLLAQRVALSWRRRRASTLAFSR